MQAVALPLQRRAVEHTHTPQSELLIQSVSTGSQPRSASMPQVYTTSSVFHSTGSASAAALIPTISRVSPQRKSVYVREENINFPPTSVGNKSTIKAQVCNRDTLRHKVSQDVCFSLTVPLVACCSLIL